MIVMQVNTEPQLKLKLLIEADDQRLNK